ncbi:MAG: hypothetical protein M3Z08_24560, partial [Chloroflexota bacterium]|nr:hypothetical protein [Chloroflexota bacterium]
LARDACTYLTGQGWRDDGNQCLWQGPLLVGSFVWERRYWGMVWTDAPFGSPCPPTMRVPCSKADTCWSRHESLWPARCSKAAISPSM